jgi:cytochrome oxidase Cu insertion factor (SCO1/SenC/PrrC family)
MKRALAIGLLAGALAAVVAVFVLERTTRRPPPPVIARLPQFELLDSAGRPLRRDDLAGRPFVADFIFTRCAVYCPRLTAEMKALGPRLPAGIRRVSITVDPEHDRPGVLAEYERKWGVAPTEDWLFLTGEKSAVLELIRKGFLLPVEDDPENAAMPILHSNRFALVDGAGALRGTYEAFDPEAIELLFADLGAVLSERDAG